MRALVCQGGRLEVGDVADPSPARGQLVLDVVACGICGSDLHARHHCDELAEDAVLTGYDDFMRSAEQVVMGHEFCGEVVEGGLGTRTKPGTHVVSMPLLRAADGIHLVGLTAKAPGAYAERVAVQESLSFAVPNGLAPNHAALTEPMAVALHAVHRGEVGRRQAAVVIGCGPVGLGVIAMLKATGVKHVVASDFSPGRRALAEAMGADVVVDPAVDSPYEHVGPYPGATDVMKLALGTMDKLRAVPFLPWQHVFRAAEAVGAVPSGPVVFECVGAPGVLNGIMAAAPLFTRVVVVGVCMGDDRVRPSLGINKELDVRFSFLYTPAEFRQALHLLADGKVDPEPLVTGIVGLDGAAAAFDVLGDPEAHAKILVAPRVEGSGLRPGA